MFATILLAILQTCQIDLGGKTLSVEIADNPMTREKGLMGRKELPSGCGMLFVFEQAQHLCFWMKDTQIPLTIGFFDEDKRLLETIDMAAPESNKSPLPFLRSAKPSRYALEVPQNWFRENGIVRGMNFSFLEQTYRVE